MNASILIYRKLKDIIFVYLGLLSIFHVLNVEILNIVSKYKRRILFTECFHWAENEILCRSFY